MDLKAANSLQPWTRDSILKQNVDLYRKELDTDELGQMDALLRYHFKIDPDQLGDSEYYKMAAQLTWVIEMENKKYED